MIAWVRKMCVCGLRNGSDGMRWQQGGGLLGKGCWFNNDQNSFGFALKFVSENNEQEVADLASGEVGKELMGSTRRSGCVVDTEGCADD